VAVLKIGLSLKTKPPSGNLACPNLWNALYIYSLFCKGGTSLPDQLHFVEMPIMGNVECQELYKKYNEENKKSIKIIDEQVCAGYEEGKIDGCNVSYKLLPSNVRSWKKNFTLNTFRENSSNHLTCTYNQNHASP